MRGVAYYGMQKFTAEQCDQALQVFDGVKHPALSILWGTFGEGQDCIAAFLERFSEVPHTLVLHTTNETCRRAPRYCGLGEPQRGLRFWQLNERLEKADPVTLFYLRARIRAIKRFLDFHATKNTKVILTTGLEDNFTPKAYRRVIKTLKRYAPHYTTARNPVGSDARSFDTYRANFIELHGYNVQFGTKSCIWSNDGIDINFNSGRRPLNGSRSVSELLSEIGRIKGNCSYLFVWWNTQGIVDGQFIEPRERTIRLYPKDISVVNKILKGTIQ